MKHTTLVRIIALFSCMSLITATRGDHGFGTGVAVGGLTGLATGAIVGSAASSSHHRSGREYREEIRELKQQIRDLERENRRLVKKVRALKREIREIQELRGKSEL